MEFLYVFLVLSYLVFAFYKRRLAVSILPLFFPLYLLRFQLFGIPFTLLEGFCYAVFVPVLIDIFKDTFSGRLKYNSVYLFTDLLFIACVIGAAIVPKETMLLDGSTVYEGRRVALGILKGFIFAPILYFISFIRTVTEWKYKELSLRAYLCGAFLLALWALYQGLTGDFITPDFRASGPFESANYLALYIGPACALSFVYLFRSVSSEKGMIPSVLLFSALFAALVFSHSYGALIGVFAAVLIFVLYSVKKFWKIAVSTGLLILFGLLFFLQSGTEKFDKLFEFTERSSSAVRIEVWQVAGNLVKEHPVLGIGLGQFEPLYQLNAPEILGHAPYEWVMLHPHNLYLAFWLNAGLLGLAAFFGLVVFGLRNFVLASKEKKLFYIFGVVMLAVILVHGFFDVPFWKNDLAMIFFLGLGVLL